MYDCCNADIWSRAFPYVLGGELEILLLYNMRGDELMSKSNKLSIYLIKDEYSSNDRNILKNTAKLLKEFEGLGKVYYEPSNNNVPKWMDSFFCGKIENAKIFTSNAKVVFITRIKVDKNEKTFAITMGHGKFLLAEDVIEDDFGLKVVLNTVEANSLRRINKINVGGNLKTSNEQLPKVSDIDEFGFDIDRDIVGSITAYADEEGFIKATITGSDILSFSAVVDINNISVFLKKVYERYTFNNYRTNFGWIDNIKRIRNAKLINELNDVILKLILNSSPDIWMAVPDVLEWEKICGFKYFGRSIYDDIDIKLVKESFTNGLTEINQLKQKTIIAVDASDGKSSYSSWQAYRCLCGEFEYNGKAYCINNGKWYCIEKDYVKQVNDVYEQIPISDIDFMESTSAHVTENQYTVDFVSTNPDYYLSMDKETISYGGGHSKIELCDIITSDNKYIHIKPYSGSSTLSHLFNQAVVSAELVIGDAKFRSKANIKIKELSANEEFLINENIRPDVILGIISKVDSERPRIPFFSKVALKYAKQRLEMDGCKLSIKNIHKTQ